MTYLLMLGIYLIPLIINCLPFVGMWRVFAKGGEDGWKAIIPFYNMYTMMKLGDKQKHFRLYLVGTILFAIGVLAMLAGAISLFVGAAAATNNQDSEIYAIVMFAGLGIGSILLLSGGIMNMVSKFIAYSAICEKLGQDSALSIGLFFLPAIFWMILGFSNSMQWVDGNTIDGIVQ